MFDGRQEDEQRIRLWAYHLWEGDGRPDGRDTEFWERAKARLGTTTLRRWPSPIPLERQQGGSP